MPEIHELVELVLHGREERNLEYKGHVAWNEAEVKARITKTVLSMCNIPDGGTIVIGVEEQGGQFVPSGLSRAELDSFSQDGVSSHVNEYADPFAEILVSKIQHAGSDFVVIQVGEFSEIPVLCKQDGLLRLRRGAVYTRTRRINETAEVPGQAEMREILERAAEKGMRALQARIGRAELRVVEREEEDNRRFEEQLNDL